MSPREDRTTSLALAPFACRFVRRKCAHEALFHDSYLRTNRTNHTKIMRCFPHCCPGHRNRSYCGSPIHIQLDQEMDPQTATAAVPHDDLVVYARFRPTSVKPMAPGEMMARDTIENSLQRIDPSQGEWIEAELSYSSTNPSNGTVSWVFEVNASGRWYYPWSGAATIALRATDHVFEVLVFRRQQPHMDLELLASVTSSTFRLMSFRRGVTATKETITDDQVSVSSKDGDAKSDESTHAISPKRKRSTEAKPPTKSKQPTAAKRTRVLPATRTPPPTSHEAPKTLLSPAAASSILRSVSVPRAASPTTSTSADRFVRPLSPPPNQPRMSTLGTLLQWLQELPSHSVGSRRLKDWERIVMDAAVARLTMTQHNHHRSHSSGLIPILSALHMTSNAPPPVTVPSPLDLIDASVRMFLHLFLEVDSSRLGFDAYQARLESNAYGSSRASLAAACEEWSRELENCAARFIQLRTNVPWSNVMTTVDTLRHQGSSVADDVFGHHAFVAQCRERSVRRQLRDVDVAKRHHHPADTVFAADPRVWTCRVEDLSIEMDAMTQYSMSLLTVLHFWRHLSCLRIDYQPPTTTNINTHHLRPAQLSLASVFNTTVDDDCYMRLTLDGQYRWFGCLPSGDATTGTTLMGFVVGDYVGRATSAGTVHVTTYLWPTVGGVDAYAWHWTLDARALWSNAMAMSVIVERARVREQRVLPFDTMSIHDKLRSVGRWDHVTQVQLSYFSQ